MKPFVIYCLQRNELFVVTNQFNMPIDQAMSILRLGLKKKYTLEYIGEL